MDAEITRYQQLREQKRDAKAKALEAAGKARLEEAKGKNADKHWKVVEEHGFTGHEGRLEAEAKAVAEAYIEAHPERFVLCEGKSREDCVRLIDAYRQAGLPEEVLLVEMWLQAKFERQSVVGAARLGRVP